MALISAPCPKCYAILSRNQSLKQQMISLSSSKSFLAGSARFPRLQGSKLTYFPLLKAQAHETSSEGSSNSSILSPTKLEIPSSDAKDTETVLGAAQQSALSESAISAFMAEVSDIVRLVDSRDIMELKLKHTDCELIIRKKEAFAQSTTATPVAMIQPPQQHVLPPQPPMPQPTLSAAAPSASTPLPPSPSKGSQSSFPPLKCPMAGTFYRSPAPGEPPFVKVGDKVQKGQVICIIEAMKLMNEIEADQSGTIVEILAEDGKPVSVDMPLLVIQP